MGLFSKNKVEKKVKAPAPTPPPPKEKVPGVTVGATVSEMESGTKGYMALYPEKATDGGKLFLM